MTMLTDNSQKRKSEIEFQLERIRKAKRLLNRQEKILMEKSVKFDKYKPGDLLFCNQELSRLDKNGSNAVLEKGQYYHLVTIIDDYAYFKSDSTEPIIIPVLDIDYYFEKGEK